MAEIPPPPGEPRYFSVVIIGAMSPPLHFPGWYSRHGLLTDEEAKSAGESPALLIAPEYSRFQTAGIRVICEQAKWEIACFDDATRSRILMIASKVFKILKETVVTAYGFNSYADLDTKASKVSEILAGLASSTGLGFEDEGNRTCEFSYRNELPLIGSVKTVVVRPSERITAVWVAYNTTHAVIKSPAGKYFELAASLSAHFEAHWEDAKWMGTRTVARINELAERTHAI